MTYGLVTPMITGKAKLVGVIGFPIEHSLSPSMHNAALAKGGFDAVYVPIEVAPDDLERVVLGLKAAGFVGINVTIPHKVAVMQFVDEVSPEAALVGAVNTLHFVDGKIKGYNTDGIGFLQSLTHAGVNPRDCVVTIFGAGGAARPIALHLASAGARHVYIVNRSFDKATALARAVNARHSALASERGRGSLPDVAEPVKWDDNRVGACVLSSNLVVNATPLGMSSYAPDQSPMDESWFHPGLVVYDTVYNPLETRLLADARAHGCRVISGVEMLVRQGAEAFRIWFGEPPDISAMRETVLACLK